MPYRDVFDFHAPLVFLINALGLLIDDSYGIWLVELHFLIGTLIIIFVALNRSIGPLASLITCLILAGLIGSSLEGGNRIEEYALLFMALGLAGFMDCLTRRRLTVLSVYLIGVSGALTFWLKPALTVFWLPFLVVILVLLARKGGAGLALTHLIAIAFSAILVFIIMVPWLYMSNALTGFYQQTGQFYLNLIAHVPLPQQLDALEHFGGSLPFVLIVCISLALIVKLVALRIKARHKVATRGVEDNAGAMGGGTTADASVASLRAANNEVVWFEDDGTLRRGSQTDSLRRRKRRARRRARQAARLRAVTPLPAKPPLLEDAPFGRNTLSLIAANLIAAFLLLYFTVEPGSTDGYLTLQLLVCLVVPLAALVHRLLRSFINKERLRAAFGLLFIVLLGLFAVAPGIAATTTLALEQRTESAELAEQRELVEVLRSFDADDEPLIVFGDDCWIYRAADSYSATRYAYQPFGPQLRPDLQTDFYRQVTVADAQILVGRVGSGLVELYPHINGYERVYESQHYEVYRRIPEPGPES
jgi:hypothetical protein